MEEDFSKYPKTRKEAKKTGSMFYFTGNPCKHGHINKRYHSGACFECEQIKYWDNREDKCAYVREYKKKNAKKVLEYNREYRENNREKDRKWKKKYRDNNKEVIATADKKYREENKEYYQAYRAEYYVKNKDRINARYREWAKNNPDKVRSKTQRYTAAKLERTLDFSDPLVKERNKTNIDNVFIEAVKLENKTGVPHEVDHIIPLQGKSVSGLHVWYNLQAIPLSENRRKSNKLVFDYIDEEEI